MRYENVKDGIFLERPNRFIAYVEIEGKSQVCHVKNTGRCKELLVPGVRVVVQECDKPERKTKFDIIAVYKGDILFNIDSQAPNKVFGEWLKNGGYFENVTLIKPEKTFGSSRFDFYFEYEGKKAFAEVKGVTLEREGVFLFPDAPTERGVKHINELIECKAQGYEAFAVFVVQAERAEYFVPNVETHSEFAQALKRAEKSGVKILCLCCRVTENSLEIRDFVSVKI